MGLPAQIDSTISCANQQFQLSDKEKYALAAKTQNTIYQMCTKRFKHFLYWSWREVLEVGTPFMNNWHIDAIAEHLEAVYKREITNLVINIPPRCTKSTQVTKAFPAWVWANDPTEKFLSISNAEDLAIKDASDSKKIITSDWYQRGWGDKVQISKRQNAKTLYENTYGGFRQPLGIGSTMTGKGGDIILIDDPHDAKEGEIASPGVLQKPVDTYNTVISTRLNQVKGDRKSRIILIMQRIHPEDLCGYLLENEKDKWDWLVLPMEFNPKKRCFTSLGFEDPRTKPDELLWPDRFGETEVSTAKKRMGPFAAEAQLNQDPNAKDGGVIKFNDFKRYSHIPRHEEVIAYIQSWDTAQKKTGRVSAKHLSFWVCTTWARTKHGHYLVDVMRKRMDYPEGKEMMKYMYSSRFDFKIDLVLIEDRSSGSSLIQDAAIDYPEIPVISIYPHKDKNQRMTTNNAPIRAGQCYIPNDADWLYDFEKEISSFPSGRYIDQIDSMSQYLNYWREETLSPAAVHIL